MVVVDGVYNMEKLYVIVDNDLKYEGYLGYAVDGLVFKDKKTAETYMSKVPFNHNMSIEELILYEAN